MAKGLWRRGGGAHREHGHMSVHGYDGSDMKIETPQDFLRGQMKTPRPIS
jgi:hypothetical protein